MRKIQGDVKRDKFAPSWYNIYYDLDKDILVFEQKMSSRDKENNRGSSYSHKIYAPIDFTKFNHTRTAQISIDLFMFFADNWKPAWDYKHSWNPIIENSYGKKTNLAPDEIMYIGDALIPIWKELTNAVRKN